MSLNIRPSTSLERRLLFIETLINMSDKVSKVSDNSVLSGIASGVAKVAGKAEKDIILAVSQLFPDTAFGDGLDQVANNYGIAPRFSNQGSSTYVRLTADPGTQYLQSTHNFSTSSGEVFELEEDVTVPSFGFTYAKVRSVEVGQKTNVDPLSITNINVTPSGHIAVVNEYAATGGIDDETDEIFRSRIKDGPNILARGNLSVLDQLFILINNKVLKTFRHSVGTNGKLRIAIATQNGQALTQPELDELFELSSTYFSLTEIGPFGVDFAGIELINITYQPIDVSFRCELDNSFDTDDIRKRIQIEMSKYFDLRIYNPLTTKIEWDDLLQIVKNTQGIKYVLDQYFYPRIDTIVDIDKLPRLRGFLMLNPDGSVISNFSGTLSPVFYPNEADFSFQQTVLGSI